MTQLFWGWIRIMILEAFYRNIPDGSAPIDLERVRSFIWLSQATFVVVAFNIEGVLTDMVRTGEVAGELLKPVGLFGNWFARSVALRTVPVILRAAPLLLVAAVWGGLKPPPDALQAVLWAFSMAAAILLSAVLTTLLSLTLLWNLAGEGVRWVVIPLVWLLSGLLMPLPLFPDSWQTVIHLLPFRGMMDVPCRIWTGHIPAAAAAGEIAVQLAWAAGLALAGRVMARQGTRRLVLQGG